MNTDDRDAILEKISYEWAELKADNRMLKEALQSIADGGPFQNYCEHGECDCCAANLSRWKAAKEVLNELNVEM